MDRANFVRKKKQTKKIMCASCPTFFCIPFFIIPWPAHWYESDLIATVFTFFVLSNSWTISDPLHLSRIFRSFMVIKYKNVACQIISNSKLCMFGIHAALWMTKIMKIINWSQPNSYFVSSQALTIIIILHIYNCDGIFHTVLCHFDTYKNIKCYCNSNFNFC